MGELAKAVDKRNSKKADRWNQQLVEHAEQIAAAHSAESLNQRINELRDLFTERRQ